MKKNQPVFIYEKGDWKQYWDPKFQKHFFYNTKDKQTQWTKPKEFLQPTIKSLPLKEPEENGRKASIGIHSDLLSEFNNQKNRKSVQEYMSDMFDIVQDIHEEKRKLEEEERRKNIVEKHKKKIILEDSPEPEVELTSPRKDTSMSTFKIEEVLSPRGDHDKISEVLSPRNGIESPRKETKETLKPEEKKPLRRQTTLGSIFNMKSNESNSESGVKRKNTLFAFLSPRGNLGEDSQEKKRSASFFGGGNLQTQLSSHQNHSRTQSEESQTIRKKKTFFSFLSPRGNNILKPINTSQKSEEIEEIIEQKKIIGTSLEDLMLHQSEKYDIPMIYQKIFDFLKSRTLKFKIFERKGDINRVDELISQIEKEGQKFQFDSKKTSVYDVTELFCMMLKELPKKIVPDELVASFANISKLEKNFQVGSVKQFIQTVYSPTYIYSSRIFQKIIELLNNICIGTSSNSMNEYTLSKVFVPLLFDVSLKNLNEKEEIEDTFQFIISNYKAIYIQKEKKHKKIVLIDNEKQVVYLQGVQSMELSKKSWKKVYLLLLEKSLHIFRSKEAYETQKEDAVIILPLSKETNVFSVIEDESHKFSYCVEINGSANTFEASTGEERDQWVIQIMKQIQLDPEEETIYYPRDGTKE
jgi:hypothetical protein